MQFASIPHTLIPTNGPDGGGRGCEVGKLVAPALLAVLYVRDDGAQRTEHVRIDFRRGIVVHLAARAPLSSTDGTIVQLDVE